MPQGVQCVHLLMHFVSMPLSDWQVGNAYLHLNVGYMATLSWQVLSESKSRSNKDGSG